MICIKCGKEAYFEHFCRDCFLENTEKRILKAIKDTPLRKDDKIFCKEQYVADLLRSLIKVPFKLVDKDKADRFATASTADDDAEAFFENKQEDSKDLIKIFKYLSDEEAEAYSKIKGFVFKKSKSDIKEFINKLTGSSEAKAALSKGVRELQDLER